MPLDRVDLRKLTVSSPKDIRAVPLDVALLQNDNDTVFLWADSLELFTCWHVIPFESLEHAIAYLEQSLPHVFVTHWHLDWEHTHDNPVTQLVLHLKNRRGSPGIGGGPFIVGTYNWDSDYYYDEAFIPFLEKTYDYHTESIISEMEQFIDTLIHELWRYLPACRASV